MADNKRLSINFAEKTFNWIDSGSDELELSTHAYLILVDETLATPIIMQELHFNEGTQDKMIPNVRSRNVSLIISDELTVTPYIVGQEKDILSMWNYGLKHAADLKGMDLKFGPDYYTLVFSNNCRTGVKAVLETMGMTFCPEFAKSAAGTCSKGIPTGKAFSFSDGYDEKELAVIKEENSRLVELLPPIPTISST